MDSKSKNSIKLFLSKTKVSYLLFLKKIKDNKYSERSVQLILKSAMKKAEIISQGRVHTLRYCFATRLINRGIRFVQELLRHSDIRTIVIYTQLYIFVYKIGYYILIEKLSLFMC